MYAIPVPTCGIAMPWESAACAGAKAAFEPKKKGGRAANRDSTVDGLNADRRLLNAGFTPCYTGI